MSLLKLFSYRENIFSFYFLFSSIWFLSFLSLSHVKWNKLGKYFVKNKKKKLEKKGCSSLNVFLLVRCSSIQNAYIFLLNTKQLRSHQCKFNVIAFLSPQFFSFIRIMYFIFMIFFFPKP